MNSILKTPRLSAVAAVFAASLLAACASMVGSSTANVALTGGEEVPPVSTSTATGNAKFTVDRDWTIQGKVTTKGVAGTAAHIHEAARGKNGPVVIPLTKSGDNEWTVPAGTRLTDAQFRSYRGGTLYVNVHSAANPGGEIRGQLSP